MQRGGWISIHALRVEGDNAKIRLCDSRSKFLSTPSGWRATIITLAYGAEKILISIHALRVEGDNNRRFLQWQKLNFYPRPPGGGRPR